MVGRCPRGGTISGPTSSHPYQESGTRGTRGTIFFLTVLMCPSHPILLPLTTRKKRPATTPRRISDERAPAVEAVVAFHAGRVAGRAPELRILADRRRRGRHDAARDPR